MIIDRPTGVVVKIFVPHKIYDHVVGEYPVGIHDEQSKNVKFLCCQYNFGFTDIYNPIFQAKIQIIGFDFC